MTPRLGPIKRSDFIARLRALGFEGPVPGARHEIMVYGRKRLAVPSDPEYWPKLQRLMLKEISQIVGREISREEWLSLRGARPTPHQSSPD